MRKTTNHPFQRYLPEVLAVGLVVVMAAFLTSGLTTGSLHAQTSTGSYTISAALTDDQPIKVGQFPDQWIARYTISTDSPNSVIVNSLDFYALGNLRFEFTERASLAPLSATRDNIVIGTGSEWVSSYGAITQLVELMPPLSVSNEHPVTVDVYASLNRLTGYTFGVELENIIGSIPASDLPVAGRAYKIKISLE